MKFRFLFFTFALLVVGAIGWYVFSHHQPEEGSVDPNGTFVALGDSLTVGFGATHGHDYVSRLSEKIGRPIVNAGQNGDTTEGALVRLDKDVLSRKPALVVILLGGNDILRGLSQDRTIQNLEEIVSQVQRAGAVPVLVGLGGRAGLEEKTKDLARRKNTPYVPNVLDGILGYPALLSDPIHPNDDGYALIANRVYDVVKKLFHNKT